MQKSIILFICSFVVSCSCLSEPAGKESEIIVIVSPEDQPHVERILGNLFSNTIYTPQPEKEFSIIYADPWELEKVNKSGNIFLKENFSINININYISDIRYNNFINLNGELRAYF